MVRTILGFALLALVVLLALKVALALLGTVIALALSVGCLAAVGFGLYLVLRVLSPATARRVRDVIAGRFDTP
jgi:hypothetical protein